MDLRLRQQTAWTIFCIIAPRSKMKRLCSGSQRNLGLKENKCVYSMGTLQFGLKYGTTSHKLVVGLYLVWLFLLCVTLDFFTSFFV